MLNFNFATIFRDSIGTEVKKVMNEMPSDKRPDQIQKIFSDVQDAIKSNKVTINFVDDLRNTIVDLIDREEIDKNSSILLTRVMALLTIMGETSPLSINHNFIAKHGTERTTSVDVVIGAGLPMIKGVGKAEVTKREDNDDLKSDDVKDSSAMNKTSKNYKK